MLSWVTQPHSILSTSKLSLVYWYNIKQSGEENKESNQMAQILLIYQHVLRTNIAKNVLGSVRRIRNLSLELQLTTN